MISNCHRYFIYLFIYLRTLVVALIGYGLPPNHCIGYLGIQKFLLPNNNMCWSSSSKGKVTNY